MAVSAFLEGKIGFVQMPDIVEYTMGNCLYYPSPDLDSLEKTDCDARETAIKFINKLNKKR
jgi:1-deoxy-D-xylulose 5-phosphate reductoisomerase